MGEWYGIKSPPAVPDSPRAPASTPIARQTSFEVLASYHVFISPMSLGSDDKLPCRAEELGAEVHTWRSAEELQTVLAAHGVLPSGGSATLPEGSTGGKEPNIVVLVEKEEVSSAGCPL